MATIERHQSPDRQLTLLVDLTADDWTIGFEGYAWHTHGDILSTWGYAGSPAEATKCFVADMIASRRPIVVRRIHGQVVDCFVPAEFNRAEINADVTKYGVLGETAEARYWDGRAAAG
jgi:hypothetical protein